MYKNNDVTQVLDSPVLSIDAVVEARHVHNSQFESDTFLLYLQLLLLHTHSAGDQI